MTTASASKKAHPPAHGVRVGIGGWNYAPWRGVFYPDGVPQSRELEYASAHVTAIEINSTYYGTQKAASFARWRDATPADFVFTLKASRYATHRRVLTEGAASIGRFLESGITELGAKLGPILWQFAPTKAFDAEDLEGFLDLLPTRQDGVLLRHALEVRHDSFLDPAYLALARKYKVATVYTDNPKFPSMADLTADFVYARLMCANARLRAGYPPRELDAWAAHARTWAAGGTPEALPRVDARRASGAPSGKQGVAQRDVYLYFINGAKEKAPAAAMALLERLEKQ
ncbi:DUF72 domain-containing protein [Achromobacter aloeverae]|uniref:DUF72 domain-containing protein n=1 Tax=Achromobacter aloeverae TaxID=1750518 RepID=A0A4Q1HNU2_9BURK|nr:DUF72 domain-containing protein [Achromobacter aloeverae]RXN92704.1 DUF72 domain-containing protein [Achromobacter aloeverae]